MAGRDGKGRGGEGDVGRTREGLGADVGGGARGREGGGEGGDNLKIKRGGGGGGKGDWQNVQGKH